MSAPRSFRFSTGSAILHSPSTNKVYTRSTVDGDANAPYDIYGVVSGTPTRASSTLTAASGRIEKYNTDIWDSISQVNLTGGPATGTVTVYNAGTAATAQIIVLTTPSDGDTFTFGLAGFAETITWRTALTLASNEVLIGGSDTAAADNLKRYFNNDGVVGVNYANAPSMPVVSAVVVGNSLTVTDLVPCARQLGWSISKTGTALSFPTTLSGGIDGSIVAALSPGTTNAYNEFDTNNPGLSGNNLPADFNDWSEWLGINGAAVTLLAGQDGASCALTYEVAGALDTYPVDGLTPFSLNNGAVVSVNLDENKIFQMRIKIDNSGNPQPIPTCVIAIF